MDYKERYEAALERARYYHSKDYMLINSAIENIFPELKESEDELTWLTKYIEEEAYSLSMDIRDNEDRLKLKKLQRSLAWLEKQAEKKPYEWHSEDEQNLNAVLAFIEDEYLRRWLKDIIHSKYEQCGGCVNDKGCVTCVNGNMKETKSEPKFHEGDWIISNNKKSIYQVIEVKRGIYVIRDNVDNHEYHIGIDIREKSGRLWSINDAEEGDVLVASDESIFIYAGSTDRYAKFYVGLTKHGTFNFEGGNWDDKNSVHPATKEQRDLLFSKMADTGYEWDADKKELKKIESKKLDADEVIAWIKNYASLFAANWAILEDVIEQFKRDFEL